jgi:hypothetical protein
VPWILGDCLQRFGGGLKQDVVDGALVLECNRRYLLRHGEHHVEVRDGQQVRLTAVEPVCAGERLALRTVPVTTRVVGNALVSAGVALLDVATQGRCARAYPRSCVDVGVSWWTPLRRDEAANCTAIVPPEGRHSTNSIEDAAAGRPPATASAVSFNGCYLGGDSHLSRAPLRLRRPLWPQRRSGCRHTRIRCRVAKGPAHSNRGSQGLACVPRGSVAGHVDRQPSGPDFALTCAPCSPGDPRTSSLLHWITRSRERSGRCSHTVERISLRRRRQPETALQSDTNPLMVA